MSEQEAVRRLVKSPPELWAQCSDPELLARHLNRFGEIRITRLEPESTVAWEGESVSGTVELEASGWGTRVRLTALGAAAEPAMVAAGPEVDGVVVPVVVAPPPPGVKGLSGLLSSFLGRRAERAARLAEPEPEPAQAPARGGAGSPVAAVTATVSDADGIAAELEAALDSLGQAHHRPYSRA